MHILGHILGPIFGHTFGRLSGPLMSSMLMATTLLCLGPMSANAENWTKANIQLLDGNGFADDFGIDRNAKTILTVEVANGWTYGDNFFFVDVINPWQTGTNFYSEFAPRLSFGKMTGRDLSFGPVKDVLLAGMLEMGDGVHAYLAGVGFAIDIPKFNFFNLNVYWRKSFRDFAPEQTGAGAQLTINWQVPFKLGLSWVFEGYFDYAWGEYSGSNPKEDNLVGAPRLLFDLGELWGAPNNLQAGVELNVWRSKYGVGGANETVPQAMIKWMF
jgi:nucleoside-specific outer membrane channel protein Tsx